MNQRSTSKTGYLVRLAVLIAIILLLEITNLGYLHISVLEMTIMQLPVLVGAIVLGPTAGAILGGVFGATSFFQCFGKSAFGATLLGINPVFAFIVCMVPRILMGWLCGLIFKALARIDKTRFISYAVAALCGALLNTILFMSALMIFFGQTEYIQNMMGELNVIPFVISFVGIQGLVEAGICFVAGTAISKALAVFTGQERKPEQV